MKVSYNWLKEIVDIPVDADALGHALTMVGLQLESKQPIGNDITLDFEVTVNRPDCLNIFGLAREIALIFGSPPPALNGTHKTQVIPFRTPEGQYSAEGKTVKVLIEEPDLCPRYCAQLITGIKVGPSPDWIKAKLEACGLRSINNVVDITNFVMLEIGQPMHAFDFAKISRSTIRVRRATDETLMMIDGKERSLTDPMLVIADADRAVAVGGVMGGMETEVSDSTTDILLESAYFQPSSVRRTARELELSTDASYRFERGADYKIQATACLRAAALLQECAGGIIYPVLDVCPRKFPTQEIRIRQQRISRILGQSIDPHLADNILTALGFIKKAENVWQVPSFRVDILKEIDLIEEIARHSGYNNIPASLPKSEKKYQHDYPTYEMEIAANQILRGAGLDEALTFSLVAGQEAIQIQNPIAETMTGLRTSLLPGLKESVNYNLRRRNEDVRLFELGRVFLPQSEKIALGIAALQDYRAMKGLVELLFSSLQYDLPSVENGNLTLHGQTIGKITQTTLESLPLQLCEIYLSDLAEIPKRTLRYEPVIPYPFVERDLSFFLSRDISYAQLVNSWKQLNLPALREWKLIDRFEGKNVPPGKVSLTIRFTFQASDRTLTSQEADEMFQTISSSLQKEFTIELRK